MTNGAAIIGADELRKLREDLISGKGEAAREAAILSKDDIERMKRSTKIETVQEKKQSMKIEQEMKQTSLAASNARKAKMQEMDKNRASKLPPSEIEVRQQEQAQGLLSKAQTQLDEELDDVKHMN